MSTSLIDIAEWIDRFGDEMILAETLADDAIASADARPAIDVAGWVASFCAPHGAAALRMPVGSMSSDVGGACRARTDASVKPADREVALLH